MKHKYKELSENQEICINCNLRKCTSLHWIDFIEYYYFDEYLGTYFANDDISVRFKIPSCDELIIKNILK